MFAQPHIDDEDPLVDLLAAARTSEDAAAELVRRTQADIWRLCRALSDADNVDDVVQETYLRAFQALPGYLGEASPRVWLLAIARRTAADHVRRAVRHRRLDAVLRLHRRDTSVPLASTVESDDLLARLPHAQRTAFVLTQILALDYAEAAAVMGCPIGTIRSRVARARDRLIADLDVVD